MSKKFSIALISFLLVVAIGVGITAGLTVGFRNQRIANGLEGNDGIPDSALSLRCESTEKVLLSASTAEAAGGNSVSKTLQATVLPETSQNKAVDWSVEWGDAAVTDTEVTEYITVTPESDGSTTATVTCLKAFTGTIVITVTTRESGYTAQCLVTFVGFPSDIELNGPIRETSGYYELGVGRTYRFGVNLSNVFGSVGSEFNQLNCEVQAVGSFVLSYVEKTVSSGALHWYDKNNRTVTLDSMKDVFMSIAYENGTLSVVTKRSIESYYASGTPMDGGRTYAYRDRFRSFAEECYYKVIFTETVSGIRKELRLRFDESIVTGVTVGAELNF